MHIYATVGNIIGDIYVHIYIYIVTSLLTFLMDDESPRTGNMSLLLLTVNAACFLCWWLLRHTRCCFVFCRLHGV